MKDFLHQDFLLSTPLSQQLYHEYAAPAPIIDYHCHIPPADIAENRQFANIAELWLGSGSVGDHYKWRLMRAGGAAERLVTGAAPDRERFQRFASILPQCAGNPLYVWTHLELKRYFGYTGVLGPDTAEEVWNLCKEALRYMRTWDILTRSHVECLITTDDPADSLAYHKAAAEGGCPVRMLPAWRPDHAFAIQDPDYRAYIQRLSASAGVGIRTLDDLEEALRRRMAYFAAQGCRVSDHAFAQVPFDSGVYSAAAVFAKAAAGEAVTEAEAECFRFHLLRFLSGSYVRLGWTMQLHFAALRNVNTRMYQRLGADTGYDCIGSGVDACRLTRLFDQLEQDGGLPQTILYSANPADNRLLVSVANCFQNGDRPGKIQHGAAWWFNDTKWGIREQLTSLAEGGVLGQFIGMLTDSRSILSYTRHEYFRRILCDWLGDLAANGEYPADVELLGGLVKDICYNNAKSYFRL